MGHDYRNVNIAKHPTSKCAPITVKQATILKRLSENDILYSAWNSGKCLWIPLKTIGTSTLDQDQTENKASVDALLDRDLVTTDGWRYRDNKAYLLIKITEAGITALRNS